MSNNEYGELFTPSFKRMLQLEFKKPVATTVNKNTGEVKHRYKLNTNEMLVYGEIACFHFHGKTVYISEQTLADQYGWTPKTVRTAIHSLENAGLINVKREQGKSNIYELLVTPSQIGEMCDQQGVELFKGYKAAAEQVKQVDNQSQEAPKQATQQTKKAEVVQLPTQDTKAPQINAVSDKPRRGRPVKDVTDGGWIVLGESEAKGIMRSLWESKYKGLNKRCPIRLSKIQEDFYTTEEVMRHKGNREGEIWKPEEYWHLTRPVFIFANKLIGMGFEILLDQTYGDYPEILWRNVRKNKKGILEFR
ncbi:helix-turn-helix domain-containing protein [Escherichia coli]|nr:GntR family transcriptional regulator [Escherichia coli]EHD1542105.1 GntR family transcriptional regulator [Escherichia coli]